ncbi:putative uncharacterized protein [Firmicutes bacterium CAG:822]|nr:putative uncharacterized protein [Firmicutes bacterium CAG:822]
MNRNKNGFTLVELLAVIVIIAIIALITTPIVLNVVQSSRENAFKDTAHGLVLAAGTYQAEQQALNRDTTLTINYATSSDSEKNLLKTKGTLPDAGELSIDEKGKVTLALWSNDARVCVVKKADAKEVTINENINDAASCTIANIDK